jgi:DNA polymerase-3 subunit delta'
VVLLHPVEALNQAAGNALLKVLEEPPTGVAFLLVCTHIDRLLPTIVSRCQRWPMRAPTTADANTWLISQGLNEDTATAALAYAGGAPLAALEFAQNEHIAPSNRRLMLDQLAAGARCDVFACAETLQKIPKSLVLGWLQRWLYDLAVINATGQPRYYPNATNTLKHCSQTLDSLRLVEYMRTVNLQRAIENHPVNPRLFFEELFLGYRSIFSKEEAHHASPCQDR